MLTGRRAVVGADALRHSFIKNQDATVASPYFLLSHFIACTGGRYWCAHVPRCIFKMIHQHWCDLFLVCVCASALRLFRFLCLHLARPIWLLFLFIPDDGRQLKCCPCRPASIHRHTVCPCATVSVCASPSCDGLFVTWLVVFSRSAGKMLLRVAIFATFRRHKTLMHHQFNNCLKIRFMGPCHISSTNE